LPGPIHRHGSAAPHCGRHVVLRFRLRHFFPSVAARASTPCFPQRVTRAIVARLLTGLCTNVVPKTSGGPSPVRIPATGEEKNGANRAPHLPQGAPTSPALANLCAYRLDWPAVQPRTVTGAGVTTRYATDDLSVSARERWNSCPLESQVVAL